MNRRFAFRLLCAAGLALGVAVPGRALAQDDATVEMARQRFREGVQFYDQHQYEKARLAFLQAYALKPHPSVLLNLAQSELRSGHPDDAANHFSDYVRNNAESANAEETQLGFTAAKAKVSEVTVNVDASGAEITLDGTAKGMTPLPGPLYVLPGQHTVEARAGDKHASRSFNATAGQTMTATLSLHGSSASLPPTAPAPTPAPAAEGQPKEEQEALPEKETHEEAAPETPVEAPPPEETPTGGRKPFFKWMGETPVALVGGVLGVAGLGFGLTSALISNHQYANAHATSTDILANWNAPGPGGTAGSDAAKATAADSSAAPCGLSQKARSAISIDRSNQYDIACQQFNDDSSKGNSWKTIAIASTVVGGAFVIGTVVYYFVDPGAKRSVGKANGFQARLVPLVLPGTATLSLVGRF